MTAMASLQTMPVATRDLAHLQDEAGVEFVNGDILEKPVSIESSLIEAIVNRLLGNAAAKNNGAHVFGPSMGYQCFAGEPSKFRKPDVSVVRSERMAGIDPKSGFLRIPPDLAVEVLSPNDLASDIAEKVEDYIRNGFNLVWVIDPATRTVMVRTAQGAVFLHEQDEITAAGVIPDFRCQVAEFFPVRVEPSTASL
jgi:Uma2 family endonuclease